MCQVHYPQFHRLKMKSAACHTNIAYHHLHARVTRCPFTDSININLTAPTLKRAEVFILQTPVLTEADLT